METVKVQYAKTHLSALLARVEAGEEIIVARGDEPIAKVSKVGKPAERELGFVPYHVPDEFFALLTDAELAEWDSRERFTY